MMGYRSLSLLLAVVAYCGAFQPLPSFRNRVDEVQLWAKKRQKRGLASIAEDGIVSTPKRQPRTSSKKQTTSSSKGGASVSSDLASWAASQTDGSTVTDSTTPEAAATDTTRVVEFSQFEEDEPEGGGRVKQSLRNKNEKQREKLSKGLVEDLESVLEGKNNIDDILSAVKKLMQLQSVSLKALSSSSARYSYRLAWVGGDDAICHIGTGLHKVPLARLQEIFLTLQGRNSVEVFEVISVLGPFPNVRNTLTGSSQVKTKGDGPAFWRLEWQSVIDGTGKQLVGKETQTVGLQVYFCDQNALIAIVPDDDVGDALENNGARVLVFTREAELDEKLEALRVL